MKNVVRILFLGGLAVLAADLIRRSFGLSLSVTEPPVIGSIVLWVVFSVVEFFERQARELRELRGDVKRLIEELANTAPQG